MNEDELTPLELQSRRLFDASVERVDMRVRSRLNQARHAALAASARAPARFLGLPAWTPAAGLGAAALLGAALWFGGLPGQHALTADAQAGFEDLEIVAATDDNNGDALEMLQDDLEFYDWAAEHGAEKGVEKGVMADGNSVG